MQVTLKTNSKKDKRAHLTPQITVIGKEAGVLVAVGQAVPAAEVLVTLAVTIVVLNSKNILLDITFFSS